MNSTKLRSILLVLALSACMERSPEYLARQIPLLSASINCDTGRLKSLTDGLTPADLAQTTPGDSQGRSALHWAIREGCDAGVDILLEAGADPNQIEEAEDGGGATPLTLAVRVDRTAMVRNLLAHGADPHMRHGRSQRTALFAAAGSGDPEILRILLDEGLEASASDLDGRTPLHDGARHPEVVRILLENGADANARTTRGRTTPLFSSSSWGGSDGAGVRESIRTLLAAGADLHARSSWGTTALMSACERGDPAAIRALLEAGAYVNARDRSGQTPLAIARRHRQNRRQGWLRLVLRVVWSEFRDREDAEMDVLDEVEAILTEAGGRV